MNSNKESERSIANELERAPDEIKLAIDLIELLENSNIPAQTVLKALEIVTTDFKNKS